VAHHGNNQDNKDNPDYVADKTLPVVGTGASAGGMEALETFFTHLSPQTGFSFIVVTHQQPGHISLLPELLTKFTTMPVLSAEDGMFLKKIMFLFARPENLWPYLTVGYILWIARVLILRICP
jgi:chemotaxis response regulator CheB